MDSLLRDPNKKAFSLTYVVYDEGDVVGMLLALFTLLPIFAVVMYVTLIVRTRSLHTLYAFVGQMLNEGANFLLKHFFAEKRPAGSDRDDPGMPSNHSQFVFFFCAYWIFYYTHLYRKRKGEWTARQKIEAVVGLASVFLACTLTCVSRLYLGYHTVAQVLVGIGFGCLFGGSWFLYSQTSITKEVLEDFAATSVAKLFYIRNTHEVDIRGGNTQFEFDNLGRMLKRQ